MLTPPPDEANEERTFHAVLDFASAGNVLPLQRIWETQRHHLGQLHRLGDAAPGFRLILDTGHLDNDERQRMLELTSLEVAGELGYSAVSKAVNSVRNDGPELIEPISG